MKAGASPTRLVWVGKPDATAEWGVSGAIEAMIAEFDEELGRTACARVRPDLVPIVDVQKAMKKLKGSIGPTLADLLIERHDDVAGWPAPVQDLIHAIDGALP